VQSADPQTDPVGPDLPRRSRTCLRRGGSPTVVTWTSATVLTPTSLKIEWAGSTCAEFADAAVDESQDTVRVTIRERSTGSDNHCNAALAGKGSADSRRLVTVPQGMGEFSRSLQHRSDLRCCACRPSRN
jgi:hypothetical protein